MTLHRLLFFSLLVGTCLTLSACSSSGRPSNMWAFDGGIVSADGESVVLDAYGIPDPTCSEFDRVESELVNGDLVVSLFYLGPTEGQFCNIPCPFGTQNLSFPLDTEREPGTPVVKDPDTGQHCSERLAPNS